MLVKFTKNLPGGEKRGFVEGREFDWPMSLIKKFRADYGDGVLVTVGLGADRSNRLTATRIMRDGDKPSRNERLAAAGLAVSSQEDREASVAEATASSMAPQIDEDAQEPGTERPEVRPPMRRRGKPEPELTPAG